MFIQNRDSGVARESVESNSLFLGPLVSGGGLCAVEITSLCRLRFQIYRMGDLSTLRRCPIYSTSSYCNMVFCSGMYQVCLPSGRVLIFTSYSTHIPFPLVLNFYLHKNIATVLIFDLPLSLNFGICLEQDPFSPNIIFLSGGKRHQTQFCYLGPKYFLR